MAQNGNAEPGGLRQALTAYQAVAAAGTTVESPSTSGRTSETQQPLPTSPSRAPVGIDSGSATAQAMAKYKTGLADTQALLQSLLEAVEKEREELRAGQQQLEEERKAFQDESTRVQKLLNDSEQVVLNVGGTRFTTTVTTLRNAPCPSLFNAMFSGRHNLKADDQGCYFIDRDGRHFHSVLNYLRDGQFNYPADGADYKFLLELRAEAEFYGLTGLVQQIDSYPYSLTQVRRAVTLNTDDSWMYEDGQDEVVFTVDHACQLLGVGLCGTEGSFTVDLEVYEVNSEDFSTVLSTLHKVSQSFCKADGQLVKLMLAVAVPLLPKKYYMLSALIKGTESYCCEECVDSVVAGGVKITFHSWESPNGTNEIRGQFPEIYIRTGVSVSV